MTKDSDRPAEIPKTKQPDAPDGSHRLEEQVDFLLKRALQRHTVIFAERIPLGLTPTQLAALAKLEEVGSCSQNQLGRMTAMDGATIKGVVDRLKARHLVVTAPDESDRRRTRIELTTAGRKAVIEAQRARKSITEHTLRPLSTRERSSLLRLLNTIAN